MRVCVDTTIFLDILKDEFRDFQDKFYAALVRKEALVSPSVVYGELLPQFKGNTRQIDTFLNEHRVKIEPLDIAAVTATAKSWMKYLSRKGRAKCPNCGHKMMYKRHFLSDFFIGGFAAAHCDALLARDRGIYKKYYRRLTGYENCLS